MSQEDVELVRALQPSPDVDLVTLFGDEGAWDTLSQALESVFHPSFETRFVPAFGDRSRYVGAEGIRQAWLDWLSPWESYRAEIAELIDAGDRVVVITDNYGRRRGMSAEVRLRGAAIWTVREGKIAAAEFYVDRDEALEAAGLKD
jgi:ketosteroid isomerase-like protein